MPKRELYTRKNYTYLFELHGKYDKRGADVLVSHKLFAQKKVTKWYQKELKDKHIFWNDAKQICSKYN